MYVYKIQYRFFYKLFFLIFFFKQKTAYEITT